MHQHNNLYLLNLSHSLSASFAHTIRDEVLKQRQENGSEITARVGVYHLHIKIGLGIAIGLRSHNLCIPASLALDKNCHGLNYCTHLMADCPIRVSQKIVILLQTFPKSPKVSPIQCFRRKTEKKKLVSGIKVVSPSSKFTTIGLKSTVPS